jgi:hypothetical protein
VAPGGHAMIIDTDSDSEHDTDTDTPTAAPASKRKRNRKRERPEHLTPEQMAQRKMAGAIAGYRELVAQAAQGQELSQQDLERASELLEMMHLPPLAWERDVRAHRQMTAAQAREHELADRFPGNAERTQQITARLLEIEQEARQLRAEHHELAVYQVRQHTDSCRRQRELTHAHPHLFEELPTAVQFRRQAKHSPPAPAMLEVGADADVGWSV